MRARRELPIGLLRRLLLAAMVVFLLAVGAIYFRGRVARRPPTPLPSRTESVDPTQTLVLSGEGFDYELTQDGYLFSFGAGAGSSAARFGDGNIF